MVEGSTKEHSNKGGWSKRTKRWNEGVKGLVVQRGFSVEERERRVRNRTEWKMIVYRES